MVITKDDLKDWSSNPVTKEIFKRVAEAKTEVAEQTAIRDTADQTAMQASFNSGWVKGADAITDAFYEVDEVAE
jgi:hypothetical protein